MGAASGQLAIVQHENEIGMTDGAGALGYNENRCVSIQLMKRLAQRRIGCEIERRGARRLFKDENFDFIAEETEFFPRRLPTSAKTLARTPSARFAYFTRPYYSRSTDRRAPFAASL